MSAGDDVAAGHAVAPMQVTAAATLAVLSILGLTVAILLGPGPRAALQLVFGCLFMALFWGLFMWLTFRARLIRQRAHLPVVRRPVDRDSREAVRRGLISAVVVALAATVSAGALALLGIEGRNGLGITLGVVLGAGLWTALQARDLRRWEASTDLMLYTRRGARRFAWTGGQAQAQLVLVRAG
jgi:succinate dehydrogenase hydrophobic anchor subunit